MPDPLFTFHDERGGTQSEHRGYLHWVADGPPVRSRQPHLPYPLRKDEVDELPEVRDFRCAVFHMANDDDRNEYQNIRSRAAQGWYEIVGIERHYDPDAKNWIIYLEWNQVYAEPPSDRLHAAMPPR